ncbi:MAG: hypothetical protein GX129_03970 [Clostridiales bacterium]|nr:hypothetical protein [Clostridiales bacterium]
MVERICYLPEEVVDLTSSGWNARLGRYFIGQTEELHFGSQFNAWSGIINPRYSGVNLYFDIFTITNYGEDYFDAEIWLNAEPPSYNTKTSTITLSNQAATPPVKPNAYMLQSEYMKGGLNKGIDIFGRIVTPNSTLVSDSHQGSIIIGPGGSFSILLRSNGWKIVTSTIVLTWWEESIKGR